MASGAGWVGSGEPASLTSLVTDRPVDGMRATVGNWTSDGDRAPQTGRYPAGVLVEKSYAQAVLAVDRRRPAPTTASGRYARLMSKKKSNRREAARHKRNARGLSLRSNRSPMSEAEAPEEQVVVDVVPSVDRPVAPSLFERMPPKVRWGGLALVAVFIGIVAGLNHTVEIGLMCFLATLLAGGAFLAAYIPPSLRSRVGDDTAVGFGMATGHAREGMEDDADDDAPTPNRAQRRRAQRSSE